MTRSFFRRTALAAALGLAAMSAPISTPLFAQAAGGMFSDGFEFLKAVKDRDGTAVTNALNKPGSTLIGSRDLATGGTALHIVAQRRDLQWIEFLLQRGANPNVEDKKGVTPLMIALNLGHVEGVEALIKGGARVDQPNPAGETPLISAVHRRDVALVRLLLSKGADPDRTDNSGRSARDYVQLMESSQLTAEIAKADNERKGTTASYGPKL